MSTLRFSWLIRIFALALSLAALPAHALAAVEIAFHSRDFGDTFPHGFITLKGVDERTSETIDVNHGFTVTLLSPAILLGSVRGEVMSETPDYVAKSDRHFAFTLTDAEYDQVLAAVDRWRTLTQPSYNLNRQNCVFFVADVAAILGMKVETPKALMKKPRSYLEFLTKANRDWLLARGATLSRKTAAPSA